MTEPANPWLPAPAVERPVARKESRSVVATGPEHPQRGVPAPDQVDQLPIRSQPATAGLWIVGVHGGAGESTISKLDADWKATGHCWPGADVRGALPVVAVARTSARGLTAARAAAQQWAAGMVPSVRLLGLILVSDAPGRLPRPLRDLALIVAGGYPRTWRIPWIESWRLGDTVSSDNSPREVRGMLADLNSLLKPDHDPSMERPPHGTH